MLIDEENCNMSGLREKLWESADILRGKMDASEYKNYLLGLIFYKYLSDFQLRATYEEEHGKSDDYPELQKMLEGLREWASVDKENLVSVLNLKIGYYIEVDDLFCSLKKEMNEEDKGDNEERFLLDDLKNAFSKLSEQSEQFQGLFDDIDLGSTKLGSTKQQRNRTITDVINAIDQIDLFAHEGDVIGDAYEYLIGQFAAGAGKKAGEFYTPQAVSRIISEIAAIDQEDKIPFHIYDPTMGSGSLMLNIGLYVKDKGKIYYHGQELNTTTYNLARMNLILHGVGKDRMRLNNSDTLDEDWPLSEPNMFDAVVMNPPYSAKWSADDKFLGDLRFESYGKLAPKSKADFAFLLHGYYHLKDTGTMGIVLPHGILFRGAAEGIIRKNLLENGAIDAVIGLPANIFYGTSIPTVVVVLKKNRLNRDVLFVDASNDFEKQKNQNNLRENDIRKIIETYKKRENMEKYSYVATFEEIQENGYNLNIPRYVDTFEEEESIDIVALNSDIMAINKDIERLQEKFLLDVEKLVVTEETKDIIGVTKQFFKG